MKTDRIPTIEDYRDLSNLAGIVYTFMSERGRQDMSYAGYLADLELRGWINDTSRYRLVLGNTLFSYDMKWLKEHPKTLQHVRELEREKQANPLRFFAPSGKQARDFINDFDNDLCILLACNRFGKTQCMVIKKIINSVKCDPAWEIFTKHGIKYRPFLGPKNVGLASYDFSFHRDTSLVMLLDWLPEKELGVYSKTYKGKGAKQVNLNNIPILPLGCGTQFNFAAMSQGQAPFEGNVRHEWGWDEQLSEAVFDGADERTRTTPQGRHDFALTPHKVEGRPDTGAGSWLNKIVDRTVTKGHRVKTYTGQIFDVPDWIYPEESKIQAFEKHVLEPDLLQDDKARREGAARFFGKWHESSGLVIDEWDSKIHVVEPFPVPRNWTLYRSVDHGDKHPAACLWGAVSPGGDLFIYRDYLRKGRVPSQIAADIVEASGNHRKKIGTYQNPKTNMQYDKYEEIQDKERYQWTMFDARAFSTNSSGEGIPLSKLYGMAGLKMKQGSGKDSAAYVPIMKEWFVRDMEKKHFVTKEPGAPRIYVFSSCTETIKTIKRWVWVERKTKSTERLVKESPTKVDDDLCDCLKLMIQGKPVFRGNVLAGDSKFYDDMDEFERDEMKTNAVVDRLTGY